MWICCQIELVDDVHNAMFEDEVCFLLSCGTASLWGCASGALAKQCGRQNDSTCFSIFQMLIIAFRVKILLLRQTCFVFVQLFVVQCACVRHYLIFMLSLW